jgi:pheromone shutdown-related protein TraB
MKKYKNLTILGTSHIAVESINSVRDIIVDKRPDLVALELDRVRFNVLMHKGKRGFKLSDIRKIGIKGFIFNLIGGIIEKKLGKIVGTKPGDEMRMAVKKAREVNAEVALIDQDIRITLRKLGKRISFREKMRFLGDLLKAVFVRQKIKFDLKKVPSKKMINDLTRKLKKRYPNVYDVLVNERNIIMGKYLYRLMQDYNNIVVVVGAGHEDDLVKEIKKWESLQKKR